MDKLLTENILIVSPTVPKYDMNSGDLRLYTLITILSKRYKIHFIATSYNAGDETYTKDLNSFGIDVYFEPFSFRKLLKKNKFKLAFLEFYFTAEYYIDRIRILQPGCHIIVDSVDVHYLRLQLKYDLTKNEADLNNYIQTKNNELAVYQKADAVITVTVDDAVALKKSSRKISCEVVPNIHEIVPNNKMPEKNTLIFIGGFSHSPNVDAVLYFCNEIMPLIMKRIENIHFKIVGSNPPDEIRLLENQFVTVTGYVPETSSYLQKSHVSVAPLRYGAGMKGKIGEAMAHGVPVVTTTIGAQGMGLSNRENVMIADSPDSFADAVMELFENPLLYEWIRNNAIKLIDGNYTSRHVAKTMVNVINRVSEKSPKKMRLHDKIFFIKGYSINWMKSKIVSKK